METELRIDVTNEDILVAKTQWMAVRDDGAPAARVEQLRRGYEQLVHAQALQIAEDFRAQPR
jgi:hypothetical protein